MTRPLFPSSSTHFLVSTVHLCFGLVVRSVNVDAALCFGGQPSMQWMDGLRDLGYVSRGR
jgi:hypothetical protein